jgi:hypothetical protein
MSTPDPFEHLLQKAFKNQSLPPVPPGILAAWQPKSAPASSPWIWLLPGAIFSIGLVLGVILAPLGLTAALNAFKASLADLDSALSGNAGMWLAALCLALALLTIDGLYRQKRLGRRR